jgi:hypothetical protein
MMMMIIIIIIIQLFTHYNCLRSCSHSGFPACCLVTNLQHSAVDCSPAPYLAVALLKEKLRPTELLHCQQTVNPLKTTDNIWTVERILGSTSSARRSPSFHCLSRCTVTTVSTNSGTFCHLTAQSDASLEHTQRICGQQLQTDM